jgi:hypothetical protein
VAVIGHFVQAWNENQADDDGRNGQDSHAFERVVHRPGYRMLDHTLLLSLPTALHFFDGRVVWEESLSEKRLRLRLKKWTKREALLFGKEAKTLATSGIC